MTQREGFMPDHLLKGFLLLFAGSLLLGGGGCNRGKDPPKQRHRPVPVVSVVTIKTQKVTLKTVLPGRTAPFRVAEIRPQVSGLILKRTFKEGTDVKAGQLLYQIDPAPFQAALDKARANLARAEADLPSIKARVARYRKLLSTRAVSRQDYDDAAAALKQARAAIQQARAAVEAARINMRYTRITAPISGRIGISNVTEGAIVTAYQPKPLTTIQQLDPIYVDVPQSTTDLLRLKHRLNDPHLVRDLTGRNPVGLILEDGTRYPLKGTLKFRDVTVDPTTGSVILRMLFRNPDDTLLPNMFVRAIIMEGTREKAILVPQQAVSRTPKGRPYVLTVTPRKRVALRMLTLDRAIGPSWLVISGLKPGDRVIVEGLQYVRPGMPVKEVPFHPPTGNRNPAPAGQKAPGKWGKGDA